MTRKQWLKRHDPVAMYQFAQLSPRKDRLFLVGCCQRIRHLLTDPETLRAVEAAQQFADDKLDEATLAIAHAEVVRLLTAIDRAQRYPRAPSRSDGTRMWAAGAALAAAELPTTVDELTESSSFTDAAKAASYDTQEAPDQPSVGRWEREKHERRQQAALLRCIAGNPFRPAAFNPAWRTSDVMLLAQGIYDDRAFDRMPILADALQDAGCDNDDILAHSRDANTPHARGCWVVDLVLGKA